MKTKILACVFGSLLFATTFLSAFPLAVNCGAINLLPAHFAIAITAAVALLLPKNDESRQPGYLDILPPVPMLLFALWAIFTFSMALSHKGSTAAAVQKLIPLLIATVPGAMIFKTAIRRKSLHYCFAGLFAALALSLAKGIGQYLDVENVSDNQVRAFFPSAAEFGTFLALTLPMLAAGVITFRSVTLKITAGLLTMIGLFAILDGASYWGAFLSILTGCAVALVPAKRPGRNTGVLSNETPPLRKPGRISVLCFLAVLAAAVLWQSAVLPFLMRENEAAHFSSMAFFDADSHKAHPRNAAWQTAACMGLSNSATGAGLGQFDTFRQSYSETVPFSEREAAANEMNQYLLLLAEGGLPMLLLGAAMLCIAFSRSRAQETTNENERKTVELLRYGCAMGIGAFAFASIWHPAITSGELTVPLVFVLVVAEWSRPQESPWEQ